MAVTVDHETLRTDELGLRTVGQVLAHLQRENRLVVHVLIDGQEPDLKKLGTVKQSPISGHTVFIETAEPKRLALEILDEVETQLDEADRLKSEAADLLQRNQCASAMEKLSGCFTTWQHAQQSIVGTAQLMRRDLSTIIVANQPMNDLLCSFTDQLRQIKSALENRDFVTLSDILGYEMVETSTRWRAAIGAMRDLVA